MSGSSRGSDDKRMISPARGETAGSDVSAALTAVRCLLAVGSVGVWIFIAWGAAPGAGTGIAILLGLVGMRYVRVGRTYVRTLIGAVVPAGLLVAAAVVGGPVENSDDAQASGAWWFSTAIVAGLWLLSIGPGRAHNRPFSVMGPP